jgi:hypothetical protein
VHATAIHHDSAGSGQEPEEETTIKVGATPTPPKIIENKDLKPKEEGRGEEKLRECLRHLICRVQHNYF